LKYPKSLPLSNYNYIYYSINQRKN